MGLYKLLYNFALGAKSSTSYLTYGRHIVKSWIAQWHHAQLSTIKNRPVRILDIGCGGGDDLAGLREIFGDSCELYGIEFDPAARAECARKGINAQPLNIERDQLPFSEKFFDVIIINQVIEHCKDIFFIFGEISRVTQSGGLVVVGTPNLAAWHDRFALLCGQQPTGIKVFGPHVRGITLPGFKSFIEFDGFFKIQKNAGSGFYPLPAFLAKILANLFPTFATAIFFKLERTAKQGSFIEVLAKQSFQTDFYSGR